MINSLTHFHTALVLLITALYWVQLRSFFNPLSFLTRSLIWFSGVAQTLRLADQWALYGHFPLSNLYESLQWLSWALTVALGVVQLDLPLLTRRKDKLLETWVVNRQPPHRLPQLLNKASMDLPKFNPAYPPTSPNPRYASLYDDLFGALLMPVIGAINLFATALPDRFKTPSNLVPALQSNWLQMHVVVMISAYACLLIGCLYALAYLVLSYGYLDHGNDGWVVGVPHPVDPALKDEAWAPLSDVGPSGDDDGMGRTTAHRDKCQGPVNPSFDFTTDGNTTATTQTPVWGATNGTVGGGGLSHARINARRDHLQRLARSWDNQSYRCIGLGFPLLTMGLLSGAVWANQTWGSYWSWDPKETWALITWFNFAIYLHTRLSRGWSGTRSAGLATVGFMTLWICYLGVNLMAKGLHSYGFFS